jgi:hypothetical protein
VTSGDFTPRLGTGLRAVPPNENTSKQQTATLAVFKWPSFRPVLDFKSNLVILWGYYLSVIPPKNDTSFYLGIGYPKLGLFR